MKAITGVLAAAIILFADGAYVARYPDMVQEAFRLPSGMTAEFEQIMEISGGDFGKSIQCSIGNFDVTGSLAAKTRSSGTFESKQPTRVNEIKVAGDGKSIIIEGFWLDHQTGTRTSPGPRYSFDSDSFDEKTSDRSECWSRMNRYLLKIGKDEVTIQGDRSFFDRLFGRGSILVIERRQHEGRTTLSLSFGQILEGRQSGLI